VEETLHRPEDALTAQEVNRRSTMNGTTPGDGVLRKPSAECGFKKGLASAVHQSSAQAAEGALIDQILSGTKSCSWSSSVPIKGRFMRRCSLCCE